MAIEQLHIVSASAAEKNARKRWQREHWRKKEEIEWTEKMNENKTKKKEKKLQNIIRSLEIMYKHTMHNCGEAFFCFLFFLRYLICNPTPGTLWQIKDLIKYSTMLNSIKSLLFRFLFRLRSNMHALWIIHSSVVVSILFVKLWHPKRENTLNGR